MNIVKNMEAVFLVVAVLATAANFASAGVPAFSAHKSIVAAADNGQLQVVTISAKRLSAAEKAALL